MNIKKRAARGKNMKIAIDGLAESPFRPIFVIPAKTGIQLIQAVLDSCLRRSDGLSDFLRSHQIQGLNLHGENLNRLEKRFLSGKIRWKSIFSGFKAEILEI